MHPHRSRRDRRVPDVARAGRPRSVHGFHDREPLRDRLAHHGLALRIDDGAERARPTPTEDVAARREVVRAGPAARQAVGLRHELRRPGRRQRAIHGEIEHDAEHDEHGERDPAAPHDEVEPDVPQQPQFGRADAERRLVRGPVPGRIDPVSHRPADTPRRGPSRSAGPPPRACRAGSGCRHRPHSG